MPTKFDLTNRTPIAEGGEGCIYEHNGKIIKVFKPHIDLKSKERKVNALMQKTLPESVICPIDTVLDRNGKFIGYEMKKATGEEFKRLSNRKFCIANNIDTKFVLDLVVKLKNALQEIHNNGMYVGDLNDQNVLFDNSGNIFLIDCDSWTVGKDKCSVAMDLFKDPLLKSDNFNENTDNYAFMVLSWKSLTRVHPFGGTLEPDIPIIDRMKKGLSVIDREVKLPKTVKMWNGFSPYMTENFRMIFDSKERTINNSIEDMLMNLSYCKKDKEYYYNKFSKCPYCDSTAKVNQKPSSNGTVAGMKLIALYDGNEVKTMFDRYTYLDNGNNVVKGQRYTPYFPGARYYFLDDGTLVEDIYDDDRIGINSGCGYDFAKKHGTNIETEGNCVYFISENNNFTKIDVRENGNGITKICKTSNNAYFSISDGNYCIINYYSGRLIVNINGANAFINYDADIQNYGIHRDSVTGKWLIILEDSKGKFNTYVMNGTEIEYQTDAIKYDCQLSCPCISNSTIFIPIDSKIRGFSYQKSAFKDFECDIVNEDSKLIKEKNKFVIVNIDNVYILG